MKLIKAQITFLFLLSGMLSYAQTTSHLLFCDIGKNQLAEGAYVKPGINSRIFIGEYDASMGLQWTFSQADRKIISGWQTSIGKEYTINEFPISVTLFALINPYSELIRETNLGFILGHRRDHLIVSFGNASRVYGLKKKVFTANDPNPDPASRIIEYRNFIYQFTGYVNNMDKDWNFGAGVTNIDIFRVQQETNPLFVITSYKRLLPGLKINADLWYQGTGMSNLSAQTYGFYGRIGVTWKPGQDK